MSESDFPPGTPVRVRLKIPRREEPIEAEVIGVVESWEDAPTGSWYAGEAGGKLSLRRLLLRKADGELSTLVVDDSTSIARIEAAPDAPRTPAAGGG